MKLLDFNEFINENFSEQYPGLKKVYLATKRSSGQYWLSYKGFAGNKFFTQITEKNIDDLDINKDYPVLTYNKELVTKLIDSGRIKEENVYNLPKHVDLSGSKEEFHKLAGDHENVPTTVYTKEDAVEKLNFPIIAKPSQGHSGMGIQIFKTKEDFEKADENKFDTFSEFIDKAEEQRFFVFKGEPFFWQERQPNNAKAKSGDGGADSKMNFKYCRKDPANIPSEYVSVIKEFAKMYENLPMICFDMMKDKNGKVFVIEPNSQPGPPFDSTAKMYEKIYEDFYGEKMDKASKDKLDEYSKQMIEMTVADDSGRFSVE